MKGVKNLKSAAHNVKVFTKHNAPIILTCVGAAGVVVTAVSTAKATTKVSRILLEAETEKGEELTLDEKFRLAAPIYIPSLLFGVATITCMSFACSISKKQQASLVGAYTMLDQSYKEYKDKVKELFGEDANAKVTDEIMKDNYPRQRKR